MKISNIYRALSKYNDLKALTNGRIFERLFNKHLMKFFGRWFK